jgi:hypothetical protein
MKMTKQEIQANINELTAVIQAVEAFASTLCDEMMHGETREHVSTSRMVYVASLRRQVFALYEKMHMTDVKVA